MATTRSKSTATTDELDALEALARRRERRAQGLAPVEVTVEQRAVALELRERDHREGCPAFTDAAGPARIEAYAQTVVAPGPDARSIGAKAGDTLVIVRCHECGATRYRPGFADLDDFVDAALERLAGATDPVPDAELDGAL